MDQEIKELTKLFLDKFPWKIATECEMFAKAAVEGGYQFKKCFNVDHKQFEGRKIL